jgi:NAD(P)-dependent dehydrogenase (short-subunit alcohol dehydrogenase family)
MIRSPSYTGKILITGGTSGLGLELVKCFLKRGYEVLATGRVNKAIPDSHDRFTFCMTDLSDLNQTSDALKKICKENKFDIIINNAGVLSPPDMLLTDDGNEYSFQVNFLSHLLINEIIIRHHEFERPLKIAATVSLVYRFAENELKFLNSEKDYRPLEAYSNSKLYLALMCSHLPRKYQSCNLRCIGFDPGVFSSGIYRMQKGWFRFFYKVAAPFMRNPEKVAAGYADLIEREDLVNGAIYKTGSKTGSVPLNDSQAVVEFWKLCYQMIEPFLK